MKTIFKRNYRTIQLYLLKEYLIHFGVVFLFFFILFFVNNILYNAKDLLSNRVPPFQVIKLIFFTFPQILALAFPFATLVGALICLGKLSTDKEILAMQSSGIPFYAIFTPFLLLGITFMFLSFSLNNYFFPLGTIKFKQLYKEIIYSNPTLEIEPFSIKKIRNENKIVITGNMTDDFIEELVIIDLAVSNNISVITSTGGALVDPEETGYSGVLTFNLDNVRKLDPFSQDNNHYRYTTSEVMELNLRLRDLSNSISSPQASEKRAQDLYKDILEREVTFNQRVDQWAKNQISREITIAQDYNDLLLLNNNVDVKQSSDNLRNIGRTYDQEVLNEPNDHILKNMYLEFYQKFAIPFSCIPFIILAFPLGIMAQRHGRAVGAVVGTVLCFLFWASLIVGRSLTMQSHISPLYTIWFSDALLLVVGVVLQIVRFKR